MTRNDKKILDAWWSTEPFGFDHPDTYNGIVRVIDKILFERSNNSDDQNFKTSNNRKRCMKLKE